MAKADPIPAFPEGTDRDNFGHWLAGFVDGEGSFVMSEATSVPYVKLNATFAIILRADDQEILRTIQSFLGVGSVRRFVPRSSRPIYRLLVVNSAALFKVIVPTFERYPLRAKKQRDFALWKAGVELCYRVRRRRQFGKGFRKGTYPRWSEAEVAEFRSIMNELKAVRRFGAASDTLVNQPEPSRLDCRRQSVFLFD
jgi:hypothetical protein